LPPMEEVMLNSLVLGLLRIGGLGFLELSGPDALANTPEVRQRLRPFEYSPEFEEAGTAYEEALGSLFLIGLGEAFPSPLLTATEEEALDAGERVATSGALPRIKYEGKIVGTPLSEAELKVFGDDLAKKGLRLGTPLDVEGDVGGIFDHVTGEV